MKFKQYRTEKEEMTMIAFRTGAVWDLILLLVLSATSYYYMNKALKGEELPKIRTLAAIEAMEEGVGRSVEADKPVHFAMGASGGQLYSTLVSMTLTGLAMANYVARLCAKLNARLIVHMPGQAESIPAVEGQVREGYLREGKPEMFIREDMRYYGRQASSWTQGVTASYAEEGVGVNISVGIFYSDCPISLELAKFHGGMNIGGTGRWIMAYAFAMMCDYVLLGEEIYAGAAQVSENPLMLSGIAIEEIGKLFVYGMIALGLVLSVLGVSAATTFGF